MDGRDPVDKAMERRAYPRIPLQLDALVTIQGVPAQPCQIRDFCLGGMFLAFGDELHTALLHQGRPSVRGTSLDVEFAVPAQGRPRRFKLGAQVVRATETGMGVTFVKPDANALMALQRFAGNKTSQSGTAGSKGGAAEPARPRLVTPEGRRAIEACQRILKAGLPGRLEAFFREAGQHLVAAAGRSMSNIVQTRYFDALAELNGRRQALQQELGVTIIEQMDRLGSFRLAARRDPPVEEASELSLVDKEAFEDFLVISEMISKAERRFERPLEELQQRFSCLLKRRAEASDNPVGPAAICYALDDALCDLPVPPEAMHLIYKTFEDEVIAGLGGMYQAMNEALERQGIRPLKPEPVAVSRPMPPRPAPAPVQGSAGESEAPGVPPGYAAGGVFAGAATYGTAQGGYAVPPGTATIVPVQGGYPMPPAAHQPPELMQAAYMAAQTLLGLQREVWQGSDQAPPGQVFPVATDSSLAPYDPRQIVDALTALQQDEQTRSLEELRKMDPVARLQGAMQTLQGTGAARRIGEKEADALSVIGRMFSSILDDGLLPERVKQRMAKLQTTLQKVAILDDGFFREQSHPARHVLNQLARLEEGFDDTGTWAVVDPVIQRIVTGFDTDMGVFSDAASVLDELLGEHKKVFQENLSKVVRSYEDQQAFVRSREKTGEIRKQPSPKKDVPEEWREWLGRAKRLKVGDIVAMRLSGDNPVRATLAWIGEEHSSYVFVDGRGMKVATLTLQELAMHLRRGSIAVIQESELSVVDRALYSMLHEMHQQLELQATHDALTGLINRREFEGRLEAALKGAIQDHQKHTLCYVDVDGFEALNEQHGHNAGDGLLKEVAELLKAETDDSGTVARLGGHAFGVLLERCSPEEGYRVAEAQKRAVQELAFGWKGKGLPVSVSIGLISVTSEVESVQGLLKAAEAACRSAGDGGGNRIKSFQPRDAQMARRKGVRDWVSQLNKTLQEDRVQLRCQRVAPMGNPPAGNPYYEILLGLRDEKGEPVPTSEFLEAAEYYNQMPTLDRWVIRNVFRWMAGNADRIRDVNGCVVNLSAHTLYDDKLLEYVMEQLSESRVPPVKVCFEVTETAALSSLSEAEQFIRTMREFGCRFSLDNFGSGNSSYSYLKGLPVDFVKIDGGFVRDIVHNTEDFAVVKSINEIAHLMGKQTIAEYVESQEILHKLQEVGVDYVQGFWIEEPVYLEDLGLKHPVRSPTAAAESQQEATPMPPPPSDDEEPEDDQERTLQLD